MKGLERYIAKHGRHFTERLAEDITILKWNSSEVEEASQRLVYYNVSEATLGDMVFLANMYYRCLYLQHPSKAKCIRYALNIIGNVKAKEYAFNLWLLKDMDIDLSKYI